MKKNKEILNEKEQTFIEEQDASFDDVKVESTEELCIKEMDELKNKFDEKTKQCEEYFRMLQRTAAEFDNFKKRTAKEKDVLYSEAIIDVVSEFLPVVDNIERALQASEGDTDNKALKEGV